MRYPPDYRTQRSPDYRMQHGGYRMQRPGQKTATVPMINAMDTATSHPNDLVGIPLTHAPAPPSTLSRFLNDPLECPSCGRKSPVIANGWNVVSREP